MRRSRTKLRWRWVKLLLYLQIGCVSVTWPVLQLFAVMPLDPDEAPSLTIMFRPDFSCWIVCVGERPGGVRPTLERYSEGRKETLCSHQEDFPRTGAWICHTCKSTRWWSHSFQNTIPASDSRNTLVFQVSLKLPGWNSHHDCSYYVIFFLVEFPRLRHC